MTSDEPVDEPDGAPADPCDCKVGRVVEAYGLHGLDADLRAQRAEGTSLRDLADVVNTRVLAAALEEAEVAVAGDAESVYVALTGDSVSPERRSRVSDRLTYAGIDVAELTGDFVSHQTVRTHLNECLDIDTARSGTESVEDARELIEWARERDETIIARTIDQLVQADELAVDDPEVTHVVTVTCATCGSSYRVGELLDRGGCECGRE